MSMGPFSEGNGRLESVPASWFVCDEGQGPRVLLGTRIESRRNAARLCAGHGMELAELNKAIGEFAEHVASEIGCSTAIVLHDMTGQQKTLLAEKHQRGAEFDREDGNEFFAIGGFGVASIGLDRLGDYVLTSWSNGGLQERMVGLHEVLLASFDENFHESGGDGTKAARYCQYLHLPASAALRHDRYFGALAEDCGVRLEPLITVQGRLAGAFYRMSLDDCEGSNGAEEFANACACFREVERNARTVLCKQYTGSLYDRMRFCAGTLESCGEISYELAVDCLSYVSLGIEMGFFKDYDAKGVLMAVAELTDENIRQHAGKCDMPVEEMRIHLLRTMAHAGGKRQ